MPDAPLLRHWSMGRARVREERRRGRWLSAAALSSLLALHTPLFAVDSRNGLWTGPDRSLSWAVGRVTAEASCSALSPCDGGGLSTTTPFGVTEGVLPDDGGEIDTALLAQGTREVLEARFDGQIPLAITNPFHEGLGLAPGGDLEVGAYSLRAWITFRAGHGQFPGANGEKLSVLGGESVTDVWFRIPRELGALPLLSELWLAEAMSTPEPGTLFLVGTGLAGVGFVWRRRLTRFMRERTHGVSALATRRSGDVRAANAGAATNRSGDEHRA